MAQYRKKPVVIEAFKYGIDPRPDWFNDKVTTNEIVTFISLEDSSLYYCEIKTLEGVMRGDYRDYIIQGVKGEIYPCKPDIFEMTYEPMNKLDLNKLEEKLDTSLENETSESLNNWLKEKRQIIDLSDEEIEKGALEWCLGVDETGCKNTGDDYDNHELPAFIAACKWYREQLKLKSYG